MVNDGMSKIMELSQNQDFYKGPFGNNTNSSTWTWTSILYYGGIGILSIGILYIGYTLYYEPSYIYDLFTEGCGIDHKGKGVEKLGRRGLKKGLKKFKLDRDNDPDVEIFDARTEGVSDVIEDVIVPKGVEGVASKISAGVSSLGNGFYKGVSRALNPFTYLPGPSNYRGMSHSDFIKMQSDHHTSVNTLYPFTSNNPYDSMWTKLRHSVFGENMYEEDIRNMAINVYHNNIDKMLRPGIQIDTVSGRVTPITSIGIPVTMSSNSIYDMNTVANISSKLNSGWNTPIPDANRALDPTTLSLLGEETK